MSFSIQQNHVMETIRCISQSPFVSETLRFNYFAKTVYVSLSSISFSLIFCTSLFLRYEKSYRLHKKIFFDFSTFTTLYSFLYSFIPFFTFLCRFIDMFLSQTFKELRWAKRWINTCFWSKSFCMSTILCLQCLSVFLQIWHMSLWTVLKIWNLLRWQ